MQFAHMKHPAHHWNQPTPYGVDEIVEVGRGVFTIAYNGGEADIVSEQNIIDLAREMEDEE